MEIVSYKEEVLMFKKILIPIFALLLGGCAATPAGSNVPNPFTPYTLQDQSMSSFTGRKAYKIGKVKVSLNQLRVNAEFPDQVALETLLSNLLNSMLQEKALLAASDEKAVELNLDIKYKRVFMGEAFGLSKGFAGSRFSYVSDLVQDGKVFAQYQSEEMATRSGVAGNLLKIGKQLTMTGSPSDEQEELVAYVDAVASTLPH